MKSSEREKKGKGESERAWGRDGGGEGRVIYRYSGGSIEKASWYR